ncbi:MAG: hypothetical protein AAF497_20680, partial [Planctomycetota bacterium]
AETPKRLINRQPASPQAANVMLGKFRKPLTKPHPFVIAAFAGFIVGCSFPATPEENFMEEPGDAFPDRPAGYFLEIEVSDGKVSREYVNGELQRIESYRPGVELPRLQIYRPDKGIGWTCSAGEKTLTQVSFSARLEAFADHLASKVVWQNQGAETVDGIRCIRFVGKRRSDGKLYEEVFIEVENGLPVRMVSYNLRGEVVATSKRTGFDLRSPDLSLFEVPDGYTVR